MKNQMLLWRPSAALFMMTVVSIALTNFGCSSSTTGFAIPTTQAQFSGKVELNNQVDILFIVDNTSSMLQHQKSIASQLYLLTEELYRIGMDYRIAVTTTSMGQPSPSCPSFSRSILGTPKILNSASVHLLKDRFIVGRSGCDTERGLDALAHVTSEKYLSENKIQFMRPEALFVVAFISDEEDKSFEFGKNSTDFIRLMDQRKPAFPDGSKAWMAHYIGSISKYVSCDALGAPANLGARYLELVKYTNGTAASICNLDLSQAVSNIKSRIIGQLRSYKFNEEPLISSIEVRINGRVIINDPIDGWSIDQTDNQFVLYFNGDAIPRAGEPVEVRFEPRHPR